MLINSRGQCKIADYGIAASTGCGKGAAGAGGGGGGKGALRNTFVGTTGYMSPERLGSEEYSYPSDVWSFGLSVWAVALGKQPFAAAASYWEMMEQRRHKQPPRLPANIFSKELCDLVDQVSHATSLPRHRHVAATSPPRHRHVTATSPPRHRHVTPTSPPRHRHVTASRTR